MSPFHFQRHEPFSEYHPRYIYKYLSIYEISRASALARTPFEIWAAAWACGAAAWAYGAAAWAFIIFNFIFLGYLSKECIIRPRVKIVFSFDRLMLHKPSHCDMSYPESPKPTPTLCHLRTHMHAFGLKQKKNNPTPHCFAWVCLHGWICMAGFAWLCLHGCVSREHRGRTGCRSRN